MKRSNTVLHLKAVNKPPPQPPQLPREVLDHILDYFVYNLDPLDLHTLTTLTCLSKQTPQWLTDKLDELSVIVFRVCEHVCSPVFRNVRYDNVATMLDKLDNIGFGSDCRKQYARQLAMFFQHNPALCLRLMRLEDEFQHHRLMLRLLNYAAAHAQYLILPPTRQRRTKEKNERVRLISDEQPGCATKLSKVVCRVSDEPDAEVLPIASFRVKCIQDGASNDEERRKEMLKCVAAEKDPLQREMLRYYTQKKGSAQERRAQYYTVTHAQRKLASPDLNVDCFEDLVIEQEGRYVHIYSEAAASFLTRCFVCTGSKKERERAFYLLRNEQRHTKSLLMSLDQAINEKNQDDCHIVYTV